MTDRQTVATRDDDGNLRWFPVAEAQRWTATTLDAGDMYFAAGRWLLPLQPLGIRLSWRRRSFPGQRWRLTPARNGP